METRGRLAIRDWGQCKGLDNIFNIPMSRCHAFKRRFDPQSGASVAGEEERPDALRPLTADIRISYAYSSPQAGQVCPSDQIQSDRDGFFKATLQPCLTLHKANQAPSSIQRARWLLPRRATGPDLLKLRVQLVHRMPDPLQPGTLGVIRSLWEKLKIEPYYPIDFSPVVHSAPVGDQNGNVVNIDHVYVTFERAIPLSEIPSGGLADLGNIVLPGPDAPPSVVEYFKLILIQWQTVVELHYRLKEVFDGVPSDKPFFSVDPVINCDHCYSVSYTGLAHSYGGPGSMVLLRPREIAPSDWSPDGIEGTLGHEFGHSLHGVAAHLPEAYTGSDGGTTVSPYLDDQGNEVGGGMHGPNQLQPMTLAFQEGVPTALGQYLVDGCKGGWGSGMTIWLYPGATANRWRVEESCSGKPACALNRFRWHMKTRGIAEGSEEWNRRYNLLKSVKDPPSVVKITSNSETRYATFACDLLSDNTDVGHLFGGERTDIDTDTNAPGLAAGQTVYYFDNYLYHVWRALEGQEIKPEDFQYRRYAEDVAPKNFKITLPQLLEAMGNFCAACFVNNLPKMGDSSYPEAWMSTRGQFSPQRLGLYMVARGWLTRHQLDNVLRANLMEELWPENRVPSRILYPIMAIPKPIEIKEKIIQPVEEMELEELQGIE